MTGVLAYLALVIGVSGIICGHHLQPFPPLLWWRALQRRRKSATPPSHPRQPRPVPSWAHTEPYDYDAAA